MVIGMIGGFITCIVMPALDKIHIDDPVGAAATHGVLIISLMFNFFKFLRKSMVF